MTVSYRTPDSDDDTQFIVSSWSRAYKASRYAGILPTEDYADVMHRTIGKLLARPGTTTLVAFEPTDPAFVYGFICGDTSKRVPILYYLYVKEAFRRVGYGRGLFAAIGINPLRHFVYTCGSTFAIELKDKIPRAKLDPNYARYTNEREHDERSEVERIYRKV